MADVTPPDLVAQGTAVCAACGHDVAAHFNGGRCMVVPCMCREVRRPAPARETLPRPDPTSRLDV